MIASFHAFQAILSSQVFSFFLVWAGNNTMIWLFPADTHRLRTQPRKLGEISTIFCSFSAVAPRSLSIFDHLVYTSLTPTLFIGRWTFARRLIVSDKSTLRRTIPSVPPHESCISLLTKPYPSEPEPSLKSIGDVTSDARWQLELTLSPGRKQCMASPCR